MTVLKVQWVMPESASGERTTYPSMVHLRDIADRGGEHTLCGCEIGGTRIRPPHGDVCMNCLRAYRTRPLVI